MINLIFLLSLFITTNLWADTEIYAVDKPDGSVAIAHYFQNSNETLEDFLRGVGLSGLPIRRIQASDIPQDAEGKKIDREFWKRSGAKVVVDSTKKQDALDVIAAKEAEREAVLLKLKISKTEFEKLVK